MTGAVVVAGGLLGLVGLILIVVGAVQRDVLIVVVGVLLAAFGFGVIR